MGVERGAGKDDNNVLLTTNKKETVQGWYWVIEDHGEDLKHVEDKQHESSMPIKLFKNINSTIDA